MAEQLPYHWRERLLEMLLAPLAAETLRFLAAWSRAEGGSPTDWRAARNNPLNTTYPMPWSTDYNTTGVKNYATALEGIAATAATIARGAQVNGWDDYMRLWVDLQKGSYTAEQLVDRNQAAISRWGTDLDLLRRVLGETK